MFHGRPVTPAQPPSLSPLLMGQSEPLLIEPELDNCVMVTQFTGKVTLTTYEEFPQVH